MSSFLTPFEQPVVVFDTIGTNGCRFECFGTIGRRFKFLEQPVAVFDTIGKIGRRFVYNCNNRSSFLTPLDQPVVVFDTVGTNGRRF